MQRSLLRLSAVLQVYGGTVFVTLLLDGARGAPALTLVLAVVVGVLSIWCGINCLEGNEKTRGLATLLWLLQVPIAHLHGFGYQLFCGAKVPLVMWLQDIDLRLGIRMGSGFSLDGTSEADGVGIGINLLAVAMTVFLWRVNQTSKRPVGI